MADPTGKFRLEKNENFDAYLQAVGTPYIPRKMIVSASPQLEISVDESGQWTITLSSLFGTRVLKFKLGEEYEEHMPGGVIIKSLTIREDNTLRTISTGPDGGKLSRNYDFTDSHCIITMKHEQSGKEAKRYFRRVAS